MAVARATLPATRAVRSVPLSLAMCWWDPQMESREDGGQRPLLTHGLSWAVPLQAELKEPSSASSMIQDTAAASLSTTLWAKCHFIMPASRERHTSPRAFPHFWRVKGSDLVLVREASGSTSPSGVFLGKRPSLLVSRSSFLGVSRPFFQTKCGQEDTGASEALGPIL